MLISYWSSDVCSSDLFKYILIFCRPEEPRAALPRRAWSGMILGLSAAGPHRAVRPEHFLERRAQCRVGVGQRRRVAEIDQAGDAVPADAAGHDAVEMRQLRLDVQGDAVEGHPAPDTPAAGGDQIGRAACRDKLGQYL